MNIHHLFKKALRGLFVVLMVSTLVGFSRSSQALKTPTPSTAYDLLLVVSTPHDWEYWTLNDEPISWTIYLFDTETWQLVNLSTNDKPVPANALSPDAQHLIVLRQRGICVVNRHWQTEFCLPSNEDYVGNLGDAYNVRINRRSPRVFWSPDSNHFWILRYQAREVLRPTIVEVNVSSGAIEREITLGEMWDSSEPLRLHDFSAANQVALLEEGSGFSTWYFNPFILYDIETGNMRLCQSRGFISTNGQEIAYLPERDTDNVSLIGEITDLNDALLQEILPGQDSTFHWESGGRAFYDFVWSHSSRMLAFRVYLGDLTAVYSLDTQETHELRRDDNVATLEWAELFWSPDDSAIARISHFTMPSGDDLDILTLDSDYFPIITDLSDDNVQEERKVYSATWIPNGWLQNKSLIP